MLGAHGRIWVPLQAYLGEGSRKSDLDRLVRATLRLELLAQQITNGWKVCQELFSCVWTFVYVGAVEHIVAGVTGTSGSELQRKLQAPTLAYDEATLTELDRVMKSYVRRRKIQPQSLSLKEVVPYLCTLLQEVRVDPRVSANCVAVLEHIVDFVVHDPEQPPSTDVFKQLEEDLSARFTEGEHEHIEAFRIFRQRADRREAWLEVLADLVVVSALFTPRLSVKRLLDESQKFTLGRIDAAVPFVAKHPLLKRLDALSATQVLQEIDSLQQMMGSVRLSALSRVPHEEIIGTEAWTEKLLRSIGLRRRERVFIQGLLDANSAGIWDADRLAEERLWWYLPWWIQGIGDLAFLFRRVLERYSKSAGEIFHMFRTAGIRSWRDLKNVYSLYHDALGFLATMKDIGRLGPLVQLGMGPGSVTVLLSQPPQTTASYVSFYRHILGFFAETLLRRSAATPVACLGCHVGNQGVLGGTHPNRCVVGGLFRHLASDQDLLICCAGKQARFVRQEDMEQLDKVVTLAFQLRVQLAGDVGQESDASADLERRGTKRLRQWFQALRKKRGSMDERIYRTYMKRVDRVLAQVPVRLAGIANSLDQHIPSGREASHE